MATSAQAPQPNHATSPNMSPPAAPTSPDARALADATATHTQGAFAVAARKLPISKAGPLGALAARLGIPAPEMVFGDNLVAVAHAPSGWALAFAAAPALAAVDATGANMLQVAHARAWGRSRLCSAAARGIQQVVRPYDWSYSTTYAGCETPGARGEALRPAPGVRIPVELLKRRDPILFFDDVVLFESELDDNGVSVYSVKVRVMEQRMLLLARLFMRLDDVIVRIRDTRVYVDFQTGDVVREYTAKEEGFADVKKALLLQGLGPEDISSALRDANQVAHLLPVVDQRIDTTTLLPS